MTQALSLVTPCQGFLLTEILQSLIWKALSSRDNRRPAIAFSRCFDKPEMSSGNIEGVPTYSNDIKPLLEATASRDNTWVVSVSMAESFSLVPRAGA